MCQECVCSVTTKILLRLGTKLPYACSHVGGGRNMCGSQQLLFASAHPQSRPCRQHEYASHIPKHIWLRLKCRKAPVPDLIDVLLVFLVWNACKTFKEGRQQSSSISGCRVMWCGIRLFDRRPFSTVRKLSGESHRQLLHLSSRFCFGPSSVHSLHDLASAASSMLGLDYQCSLLCGFCLVSRSTDNLSTYLTWQLAPDI